VIEYRDTLLIGKMLIPINVALLKIKSRRTSVMHPVSTRVLINKKYFRREIYATVCYRRHEEIIQEFTRSDAHIKYAAARAAIAAVTVAVATVAIATVTVACGQLSLALLIM